MQRVIAEPACFSNKNLKKYFAFWLVNFLGQYWLNRKYLNPFNDVTFFIFFKKLNIETSHPIESVYIKYIFVILYLRYNQLWQGKLIILQIDFQFCWIKDSFKFYISSQLCKLKLVFRRNLLINLQRLTFTKIQIDFLFGNIIGVKAFALLVRLLGGTNTD